MDADAQYDRFRQLVRAVAEDRLKHVPQYAQRDWLCRCYVDRSFFEEYFPDPDVREDMLRRWEAGADAGALAAEISRMNREGLTYTDLEALDYEFPMADADSPDEKSR
jgi:hypothetical protein